MSKSKVSKVLTKWNEIFIMEENGRFFMGIVCIISGSRWEEISKKLYLELLNHNTK